ncbi:hypothetical protein P2G88_05330 [Aliiglaciecola sp. CAU 1673]|uniref:hypothetical protein n=1 Tax=Aliiglaciecola sp. CAU 1673 TaxID=3032595 RepID=UPI0023D986CF|nr:hypothetical protein [Aliiglaciecola sp. CAU 1673]MDF2177667.1 hypothetical protein [Aliiglaciecola sp. CAU 1673]
MALPLLWLGAGVLAVGALSQKRPGHVKHYPGAKLAPVTPKDGAVVCCGIYGLFDHSGIWLDGHILELKGNGLIRAVSSQRFVAERSGKQIYVACDGKGGVLADPQAAERGAAMLFQYRHYHVLNNNCHRFTWYCLTGRNEPLSFFSDLNAKLSRRFRTVLSWHPAS